MNHKILTLSAAILILAGSVATAQPKRVYTEASDLTLIGKIMPTPNPYHRVDTVKYKGFTKGENNQVRQSSGIACVFRTDSKKISVKTEFGIAGYSTNSTPFSTAGYDLYIKKDGKWLWAGAGANDYNHRANERTIVEHLDGSMHECLLYFPTFSEEYSVKIITDAGSTIEAIEPPFRHRVAIFGSSYTHGASTSRAGMTYPAIFTRNTGIQMLSLGCSGNSKLQSYFADVLVDVEADAFVFDAFSNPNPQQMKDRLFPFIEKLRAAHPGIPLIFQRTIRRDKRNFDTGAEKFETEKMRTADSLMAIAVKKYDDVYYVKTTNASSKKYESFVDGVHPGDYGYSLWAESIEKPLLKIFRKYGIK